MNVIKINELSAPELDIYARLNERQLTNRREPGKALFVAESPLVIRRALDAGCKAVSVLTEPRHLENTSRALIERCGDVPVYTAELDVLTKLTGFKLTRGMLCAMRRPTLPTASQLCAGASRVAVLENIMNPTNLGAAMRSAAALNMDAILLTEEGCDPLYRRAARVSMGTVFQVPWAYIDGEWPKSGVEMLHSYGFKLAAMALKDDSISLDDSRLAAEKKLAVVLGTEGEGLSAETIASCDYTIRIPMSHGVDSLNVAAASAIAFYILGHKEGE